MISTINELGEDFLLKVARGEIPGMKTYIIAGRKDGISNTVLDDLTQIPGTTIAPSPGGIQLEVVSTAAADDGDPVGTGIRTLSIHYLDTSGLEQAETVTLNGVGAVTTVATDIAEVQWMNARTVGSNGVSVGAISLQGVGGGTVYEYIAVGGNQSLSARYVVPTGKTAYVIGGRVSAIVEQVDFRLRATVDRFTGEVLPGVFLFQDTAVLLDGTSGYVPQPWSKLPATAHIKLSALSQAAGGNGGGSFQLLIVDD